jgi:hypothetical protein
MLVFDEADLMLELGDYASAALCIEKAIQDGPPILSDQEIDLGGEKVQCARRRVWRILDGRERD